MRKARAALPALALSALLAACAAPKAPRDAGVSIMSFNVQNLFDTTDDPGKDDKAYLPLGAKQNDAHRSACMAIDVAAWRDECLGLDWNEAVLEAKLEALARTIRAYDDGPDIIAFQEVENIAVLERLRVSHLAGLGYGPAILIEGQDLRGIDVAFLSKLPLVDEPALHPVEFPAYPEREADTRGILQATFALPGGALLTGLAVHFPAPFHPPEMRRRAFRELTEIRAALPDEHNVFAAGDFNTTSEEMTETAVLDDLVRPDWTIAHETGCSGCKGTYYYAPDDSWSFLDMILFSPARSADATWRLRADSTRIVNGAPQQQSATGTPKRFSAGDLSGVSDHWPLAVLIDPVAEQ